MRRVAVILLALIFAGIADGVGCFALGAAMAAADSMACCTPQCPAPKAPRQSRSCSAQPCAPSAEVAPASHGAPTPQAAPAWMGVPGAYSATLSARAVLLGAAAPRYALPPPPDASAGLDRLCSRQI
jgi:hypothetical protein